MNKFKTVFALFQIQILSNVVYCYPSGFAAQSTAIIAPFANLDTTVSQKIDALIKQANVHAVPPFPDSGRQHARLEKESFVSQLDTKYGRLQEFVAGFVHPKPVVDTIEEYEKYGNDGGTFRGIATGIISKVEGASNLLNTAVDLPFAVGRQVGKKITGTLNEFGGQLVGI